MSTSVCVCACACGMRSSIFLTTAHYSSQNIKINFEAWSSVINRFQTSICYSADIMFVYYGCRYFNCDPKLENTFRCDYPLSLSPSTPTRAAFVRHRRRKKNSNADTNTNSHPMENYFTFHFSTHPDHKIFTRNGFATLAN